MLRKMYKFIILAAASITALKGQTFQLAPQIVEIGSVFTMNCLTAIDDPIAFLLNDTTKGSCPAPFGVPQPCDPTDIAQDQATTNTSWTITATSSHNGTWKCKKGLDPPSNSINLQTYLCAKTTLSENGINSDLELNETSSVNITFQTGCIYPSNNPEIILQFKSGTQEINSVLNCVESETACTDGTAFECTNHISYGMSLMNGQFSFKRNYTLHFKVSTTVRDCSSIAIFDQYLLSFIQTGETTQSSPTCDCTMIYAVHFILTFIVVVLTFFVVIFKERPDSSSKKGPIFAAVLIDIMLECIILWGFEFGFNFRSFRTNDACKVGRIVAWCHGVIAVVLVVKFVVLIQFTEKIQGFMASCNITRETKETTVESGHLTSRSNDHATRNDVERAVPPRTNHITQPVTTPEDITLLMHFSMPPGYQVHHWIKEDSTSLHDSSRHVSSDRGTLHIKSATAEDNGIYQSLLVSGNSELRVNVILHVTGLKSVSLMVDPLVWRQIKSKKLKQIHDLKKISKHLSINNFQGIPSNLKRSDETDVTVTSIRWTHNGNEITGPSPWKSGTNHLQRFTVQRETPIDEYHCRIEFSDRKAYIFIFILKFTVSAKAKPNIHPSDSLPNNKVDAIEEVVGVPTIINTKRDETESKLKPLRETAKTTTTNGGEDRDGLVVYKNDFNQMTARSGQSTERKEQL